MYMRGKIYCIVLININIIIVVYKAEVIFLLSSLGKVQFNLVV